MAGVQVNGHSIDGTNVDAAGERPARSMSEFKAVIVRHAADRRGKFIEPRARVAHRGVPVESAAGAVRRLDLEPIEMGRAGIDDMRVVYADRKSGVEGKSVSVRVDLGGGGVR